MASKTERRRLPRCSSNIWKVSIEKLRFTGASDEKIGSLPGWNLKWALGPIAGTLPSRWARAAVRGARARARGPRARISSRIAAERDICLINPDNPAEHRPCLLTRNRAGRRAEPLHGRPGRQPHCRRRRRPRPATTYAPTIDPTKTAAEQASDGGDLRPAEQRGRIPATGLVARRHQDRLRRTRLLQQRATEPGKRGCMRRSQG